MIKCFILSVFLLLTTNLQPIQDKVSHKLSAQISKSFKGSNTQPVNINIVNKTDNSNIYQILTILGGFLIMAIQVSWQHKGSLKLQKENSREELKLAIYEKIEQAIAMFNKSEISSYLTLMQVYLTTTLVEIKNNSPLTVISSRTIVFMEHNEAATHTALQVCFLIESWEIISPEFKVFRLAINSALHDLRESFIDLYPLLRDHLPIELPIEGQSKTVWPHKPNERQLLIIQDKISVYLHNYNQLVGYMYDIQVLSQNMLLGNLFEHRLEFRKPLDPKFVALNFDTKTIKEWVYFFEYETNWGISCRKSETSVIEQLKMSSKE